MFEILNDKYINLLLSLTKESGGYEELKPILAEIDMKKLFDIAVAHELDGVAAAKIIKYDLCELPDYWKKKYDEETQRLTFLKNKATDICRIMDENGIKMVVLKNGGIMSDMIEDPAACPMEDIDSLVKKSDFKKAHEILINNGFVFKFRSEYEFEKLEEAYRDGSTEYYIEMPDGNKMWFELAWRAVAGRWIRLDKEPDTDDLMKDAYYAEGTKVGILSPEDNLLQVCIHTAKHSYVRAPGLRLHMDVDRIVNHKSIDWDLFIKKVNAAHVRVAVYFSLLIPYKILGTPIPDFVLEQLKPKKAKEKRIYTLLSNAGLLYPKKRKFSKLQFLKFQMSLYDSAEDMLAVLYPKNGKLHELYQYKNPLLTPYYILLRGLDLVGIRKKKKD
ncbi:MAG: nucleotidyltransferase family protein [Clostridia bacterium]|nr:nucleotidyltransferase family protein [Clostridia bacterium]